MNEEDLRSGIPAERRLPPARRAEIKETLMATMFEGPSQVKRPRRRRAALGAIAIIATAGVATAAAAAVINRDRPDPVQAEAVNRELGSDSPAGAVHTEGWRPELSAETVECVLTGGTTQTFASEFPIEQQLTEQHLVDECTSGNDLVRSGMSGEPTAPVLCAKEGDYPQPVVLANGATCASTSNLRTLTAADMNDLNQRRAFDVSILAVPSDHGCPTLEEAAAWAKRQVNDSGYHLTIDTRSEGRACYRGVTDWARRIILVQALGPQSN